MKRTVGGFVLGLSACGYPLIQLVVRRWGVRGAAVAQAVCAGLAVRDAAMVAGVPGRPRPVPAGLLHLEQAAAMVASLAGLGALLGARSPSQGSDARADTVRRAATARLFAVDTVRFGIYLRPGQGRRALPPSAASARGPGPARRR